MAKRASVLLLPLAVLAVAVSLPAAHAVPHFPAGEADNVAKGTKKIIDALGELAKPFLKQYTEGKDQKLPVGFSKAKITGITVGGKTLQNREGDAIVNGKKLAIVNNKAYNLLRTELAATPKELRMLCTASKTTLPVVTLVFREDDKITYPWYDMQDAGSKCLPIMPLP